MRGIVLLLTCRCAFESFGQVSLPFYYEQNLPLYGHPLKVEEYYYEYHTQAKAYYYHHTIEYDAQGRVQKHVKSNVGLLDLDNIPEPFHGIIDTRPVTITYSFRYDSQNRLSRFSLHNFQEQVATFQRDEEWKYDAQGMEVEHNFWDVSTTDTLLKNPSSKRVIYRDASNRVQRIEKYTFSFADKALVMSGITENKYGPVDLDTVTTYRINEGSEILVEKKYNLSFKKYDPLNTDSLSYTSYTAIDNWGEVTQHTFVYDGLNRKVESLTTTLLQDTVTITDWLYEPLKITETTDRHTVETHYDETGYERYHEEFEDGYSLRMPEDMNTRETEDGEIKRAILEIWDPVARFYRKDTEYTFYHTISTGIEGSTLALKANNIYPNPSTGTLYLENARDMMGVELISSEGTSVPLSVNAVLELEVPKGLYLLSATFRDGSIQRTKIMLE